jgi:hypothetical protein
LRVKFQTIRIWLKLIAQFNLQGHCSLNKQVKNRTLTSAENEFIRVGL